MQMRIGLGYSRYLQRLSSVFPERVGALLMFD